MTDILHKVGDVSIILAPILAVYLLQSEFTLQVRSVLFLVLLELNLNFRFTQLQVWKAARYLSPPLDTHIAAPGATGDEAKKAKGQYRFELVCRNIALSYLLCTGIAGYVMVVVDSDKKKRNDPHFVNQYLASLLFPFSYTVCNVSPLLNHVSLPVAYGGVNLSVYQHYIGSIQKVSVSSRGSKYVNILVTLVD